jgi:hypothetical protein
MTSPLIKSEGALSLLFYSKTETPLQIRKQGRAFHFCLSPRAVRCTSGVGQQKISWASHASPRYGRTGEGNYPKVIYWLSTCIIYGLLLEGINDAIDKVFLFMFKVQKDVMTFVMVSITIFWYGSASSSISFTTRPNFGCASSTSLTQSAPTSGMNPRNLAKSHDLTLGLTAYITRARSS